MNESGFASGKKTNVRSLVYIALFMALLAVCAWISIPTTPPFTMQTFGVFVTLALLGGKRGTAAFCGYLLLGALGAPVFASFQAGPGVLVGATGGYLLGFLLAALLMWALERWYAGRIWRMALMMLVGLLLCYAFGTGWFMVVYAKNSGPVGLAAALGWCVFPFILPDLAKIALALLAWRRLSKYVKA